MKWIIIESYGSSNKNEYEPEVHRIIHLHNWLPDIVKFVKSYIPSEKILIRIYVLKEQFINIWHLRNVIDCFGSKKSSKMRKYMNRG